MPTEMPTEENVVHKLPKRHRFILWLIIVAAYAVMAANGASGTALVWSVLIGFVTVIGLTGIHALTSRKVMETVEKLSEKNPMTAFDWVTMVLEFTFAWVLGTKGLVWVACVTAMPVHGVLGKLCKLYGDTKPKTP